MNSTDFWSLNIGHIITLVGVIIAYIRLRDDQARDRRQIADTQQKRHEENLEVLGDLKSGIARLEHLDPCMDEVKESINDLRKQLMQYLGNRRN